jgi:peptide-methionine (R)-S-oxide reductase
VSKRLALGRVLLVAALAGAALLPLGFAAFGPSADEPAPPVPTPETAAMPKPSEPDFAKLSEEEWRKRLTADQFHVLREKGTERAFTGEYWDTKTPGVYACRGCGTPLFLSDAKFDSGCGWPSFFQPLDDARLEQTPDHSFGMRRIEVTCKRCGGHLGHVFEDGPPPTGLRFCINSVSIQHEPAKVVPPK